MYLNPKFIHCAPSSFHHHQSLFHFYHNLCAKSICLSVTLADVAATVRQGCKAGVAAVPIPEVVNFVNGGKLGYLAGDKTLGTQSWGTN